jgi:hypothetical protein
MKLFIRGDEWSQRWNFVDDNNVILGYCAEQNCCERFGFKILAEGVEVADDQTDIEAINAVIEGFEFDPAFHKVVKAVDEDSDQCVGAAEFRATRIDDREIVIYLFNYHNGYYSHGFYFSKGEESIMADRL